MFWAALRLPLLAVALVACSNVGTSEQSPAAMHPRLHDVVESILPDVQAIDAERREPLDALAAFVAERRAAGEPARLLFICTHNSRRSHLTQIWAATAAAWFEIDGVETYSGGTEATAFNPRAVEALERVGFSVEAATAGDNPHYRVTFAPDAPALEAFSKVYDQPPNPTEGFAAVMTCSQADKSCPFVRGAALRIALPYDDPKAADGTSQESATYDARNRLIATEMLYLFSRVGTSF